MAKKYSPPSPPFIAARHKGGKQKPKAIVLHGTVSSDDKGTARNIANWWAGPTSPKSSCHYVRDPKETIQCVGDHTVAYHCGYNQDSIGYEFCDEQTGPAKRWNDKDSNDILRGAARDIAELCLAYGIAARRPTVADLKRKGPHGIYGHNDSRLAFGGTTHTDPRDFPWAKFLRMVNDEINEIKGEAVIAKKRKRFKVLHAPLHGNSATRPEMKRALNRPGVVAVTFSEGYKHGWFFRTRPGWRPTMGSAKKDGRGRMTRRDAVIMTRRFRKHLGSGIRRAGKPSTPAGIAPQRWCAYTVDNVHGKPLAVVTLHPHAAVRKAWGTPRARQYRESMKILSGTIEGLREVYGADLDIVVTGDLQYTKSDPKRRWSPAWVFDKHDLSWVNSGLDWMAYSEGLKLVRTKVIAPAVNGQDHPWVEGTFERV